MGKWGDEQEEEEIKQGDDRFEWGKRDFARKRRKNRSSKGGGGEVILSQEGKGKKRISPVGEYYIHLYYSSKVISTAGGG